MKKNSLAIYLLASAAIAPTSAWGQTATTVDGQADRAAASGDGDGDIIVTAQKRNERLQDVPIAMTAFNNESLVTKGIDSSRDLGQVTPGLNTTVFLTYAQPFIRGIGNQNTAVSDEPSVSTYVDGVYVAQTLGQVFDFNDVERIEVLKGPQGTLFGRNATGGAILITTATPSFEPSGKFDVSYGNLNTLNLRGYVSTGLAENVAASLTGAYSRRDSLFYNVNLGQSGKSWDRLSFRGKLMWFVTEDFKVTLAGDYTDDNNAEGLFVKGATGKSLGTPASGPFPTGRFETNTNILPVQPLQQYGASIRLEYSTPSFDIVSINGYRRTKVTPHFDMDSGPAVFGELRVPQVEASYSSELQIVSTKPGPFKWIIGAYHFHNKGSYTPLEVITPAGNTNIEGTLTTNSFAGFADGTYDFGKMSITGGVRYSWEKRRYYGASVNGFSLPVIGGDGTSATFEAFTPRVILSYKPTEDVLAYASFSKGFKSGLFNAAALASDPVRPEKTTAYEIGLKMTLAPSTTLNVSAFYYDSSDLQVQATLGSGSLTQLLNAASAQIKGFDADLTWRVAPGFNVRAGVAYLDGKYRDFENAVVFIPFVPDGSAGNELVIRNASGNSLVRAPKWTLNIGGDYKHEFSNGASLQPSFNLFYSSRFAWDPLGRIQNKSYVTLNTKLTYTFPGEKFFVSGWAKNLTDSSPYATVASNNFGDLVSHVDPRTYGIMVGTKF